MGGKIKERARIITKDSWIDDAGLERLQIDVAFASFTRDTTVRTLERASFPLFGIIKEKLPRRQEGRRKITIERERENERATDRPQRLEIIEHRSSTCSSVQQN